MKIEVSDKTKKFYLAFGEWKQGIGHEISVGKYRFSAVPTTGRIIISEVNSGTKFIEFPITPYVMARTATKEETVEYLLEVGEGMRKLLQSVSNIDGQMALAKAESVKRLGPMPEIETFESDWIFEESNGTH